MDQSDHVDHVDWDQFRHAVGWDCVLNCERLKQAGHDGTKHASAANWRAYKHVHIGGCQFNTGWSDNNCYLRLDVGKEFVFDDKMIEFFANKFQPVDFVDQIETMMVFSDCEIKLVNRRPASLVCKCGLPSQWVDLVECKCYCQACKLTRPDDKMVYQTAFQGRQCDICKKPTFDHVLYDLDADIDVCLQCMEKPEHQQFIQQHQLPRHPAKSLDLIGCPDFQCILDWLLVAELPTSKNVRDNWSLLVNANPDAKLFGRLGLVTASCGNIAYWLLNKPTSDIVAWIDQQNDMHHFVDKLIDFCQLYIPAWLGFRTH